MAIHGIHHSNLVPDCEAGVDLSSYQFRFVKYYGTGQQVTFCGTQGESAIGVLGNAPDTAGDAAQVVNSGLMKVDAGGTISAGAKVMTDTVGRAIAWTAGNAVLGRAHNSAVSGDRVEILLGTGGQNQIDRNRGYIPLDISSMREIASNDIQALAAHGGILANDSEPKLARVNAATDKALRVVWAGTAEAQFAPVAWPADLDATANVTVHLLAAMAGATDTPTIDVQAFEGVGDTEMGGATAAVTGTTVAEYSATLSAANIAGHPGFLNLSLVPGAHTTDLLYLYGAWIEYTKA